MAETPDLATIDDDADGFEVRALMRMLAWGIGAGAALLLAILAGFSEPGERRMTTAVAMLSGAPTIAAPATQPPPQTPNGPSAAEWEARQKEALRLSEAVEQLTADRERLAQRIAVLERSLEDVTGSIKRYEERAAAAPMVGTSTPAVEASPPTSVAAWPAPPLPGAQAAPVSWPEATVAALSSAADPGPENQAAVTTLPVPQPRPEPLPPTAQPDAAASTPKPEAAPAPKPTAAPPQPTRTARLGAPVRGGYGVDLGGAVSVDRLRMLWSAVRSNQPRLLQALRPVASTRRPERGGRPDVRLVAGPLASAEDAARLCAALLDAGRYCEPTRYEGHRLR